MREIKIKPLSVNKAWRGRRFKTDNYKAYEIELMSKLKPIFIPRYDNLSINIEFGFSNKGSDIDNPLKPFLDILQKKYKFNDSRIYSLHVTKKLVKKGEEFIRFEID